MNKRSVFILVISLLSGIILDQASKFLAITYFTKAFRIIPGWIEFSLIYNEGIAFGLNITSSVILAGSVILICISSYLGFKYLNFNNPSSSVIFGMFLSGAISNLIDRIRLGEVIDFISIYRYPVFNLADVFITLSVVLILIFPSRLTNEQPSNK